MPVIVDLKALELLRRNIRALLESRHESETSLAFALGFRSRSSLNKFLNSHRGGFQMWRLDKAAAFFGLPVYQLFQPGISQYTERRRNGDRRKGRERRVGHAHRITAQVATEIDRHRPTREAPHEAPSVESSALLEEIRSATTEYERRISALVSQINTRGQTAPPSGIVATARRSRRTARRSDSEEG